MKNKPSIVLGTWSWGSGAVGGDQVFGNHVGTEDLKPVFDEVMANGLNRWDSAVMYGMGVVLTADEERMLEDTAENTGVDTRGSWENPMI